MTWKPPRGPRRCWQEEASNFSPQSRGGTLPPEHVVRVFEMRDNGPYLPHWMILREERELSDAFDPRVDELRRVGPFNPHAENGAVALYPEDVLEPHEHAAMRLGSDVFFLAVSDPGEFGPVRGRRLAIAARSPAWRSTDRLRATIVRRLGFVPERGAYLHLVKHGLDAIEGLTILDAPNDAIVLPARDPFAEALR